MIHCLYRMFCLVFSPPFWVGQGIQFGLLIVTCVLVYRLLSHRFRGSETADFGNNYLLLFAFVSTLTIYVVSYWTTSQECETIGIQFFDFFSCLLLVTILLDIFRIRQAEREQMVMERLLRQEQEQHMVSRATMDVINRKCHDLRHQITALRHMDDAEKEKSIQELEHAVMIYDSFPKSGNTELDIILAEKSLLAEKQQTRVQCIVDGSKLSFWRWMICIPCLATPWTTPSKPPVESQTKQSALSRSMPLPGAICIPFTWKILAGSSRCLWTAFRSPARQTPTTTATVCAVCATCAKNTAEH